MKSLMSYITHLNLLALPCLDNILIKELEHLDTDIIWNKQTPQFRKAIIEATIKEWGLGMHNLFLFDKLSNYPG